MARERVASVPASIENPVTTQEVSPGHEKDPYQQAEWGPLFERTSGYAETFDQVVPTVFANRGRELSDLAYLEKPTMPTAERAGLDMHSVGLAAERFRKAATDHERVLIYGDSDLDGVASTTIAYEMVRNFGVRNILRKIPSRDFAGFGFSEHFAKRYSGQMDPKDKFDLILTVDNGVASGSAIAIAQDAGTEVMVLDHHTIQEEEYPKDSIVLHTRETSAAGIAYLLSRHYTKHEQDAKGGKIPMSDVLALAGIAVFADVQSMNKVNHPLVKAAIQSIRTNPPLWMEVLAEADKWNLRHYKDRDISFGASPLLNTPGRYGEAMELLKYFAYAFDPTLPTASKMQRMRPLAEKFARMNSQRKQDSDIIKQDVLRELRDSEEEKKYVYHVAGDEYPGTTAGISPIASQILFTPSVSRTVVLGKRYTFPLTGDEVITYEARAPRGKIELIPLVEQNRDSGMLYRDLGGGHNTAVGYTIAAEDEQKEIELIDGFIDERVKEVEVGKLKYDLELPHDRELYKQILEDLQAKYQPWSYGLDLPLFLTRKQTVTSVRQGTSKHVKGKFHLFLTLQDNIDPQQKTDAIMWNADQEYLNVQIGETIDHVSSLDMNMFTGSGKIQVMLEDFRRSTDESSLSPVRSVPSRDEVRPLEVTSIEEAYVPGEIAESLRHADIVGWDRDDTLQEENPLTASLRHAACEAWHYSQDEYFRREYSRVEEGTPEWDEYLRRIREVSFAKYGRLETQNGTAPEDRIMMNAYRHRRAIRHEEERAEVYYENMEFPTSDAYTEFYIGKFMAGLERRPFDEFSRPIDGAVDVLNFVHRKIGVPQAIISNSRGSALLDTDVLLKQHGYTGGFEHIISANSINHFKPDPYAFRNLIMHQMRKHPELYTKERPLTMVYIGNNEGDTNFPHNALDFEKWPSSHTFDPETVRVAPIIVTRGEDFSSYDLPLHGRFTTMAELLGFWGNQIEVPKSTKTGSRRKGVSGSGIVFSG